MPSKGRAVKGKKLRYRQLSRRRLLITGGDRVRLPVLIAQLLQLFHSGLNGEHTLPGQIYEVTGVRKPNALLSCNAFRRVRLMFPDGWPIVLGILWDPGPAIPEGIMATIRNGRAIGPA